MYLKIIMSRGFHAMNYGKICQENLPALILFFQKDLWDCHKVLVFAYFLFEGHPLDLPDSVDRHEVTPVRLTLRMLTVVNQMMN